MNPNPFSVRVLIVPVIAEIKNLKGDWLLVKQASNKQDAGQYVSPVGGHVRARETDEDALKRETLEEVGLKDFKYTFMGRSIFNRPTLGHIENHYFILYEIYSDDELQLNDESEEYKRFTLEEIKNICYKDPKQFGDAFHFVLKTFYSKIL